MATFTMDMPPALGGDSKDAAQLRSYLARLVDRLLYCLNHLDDDNLVEGGVGISRITGGSSALAGAVVQEMGNAQIGTSTVQHLNAQVAEIVTAVIQHAVVDWANLKHAVADEVIAADFVGERMYVRNLAVTAAQMVDLTVGQLTVKASDGNYYKLDVDIHTGLVTARQVTVTVEEIAAGETASGSHIIETSLTVEQLSASTIKAVEMEISRIMAARIDVDTLCARQAFIQKLTTGEIALALGNAMDLENNSTIGSIRATQRGIQASVQELENGIGTHVIIEPSQVRITQDQSQRCELQLDTREMRFVDQSGNTLASYGLEGSRADRMRSNRELAVGTLVDGWLEFQAKSTGVAARWRNGTGTRLPAIIIGEPEDAAVTLGSGSHPLTGLAWIETARFTVMAQNAVSYQWQEQRMPGGDWANITGEDENALEVVLGPESIGHRYRCLVTGTDGTARATRAARIRINGGPVVLVQPRSTAAMPPCSGSSVTRAWQWRTGNTADGAWTGTDQGPGTQHVRLTVTDGDLVGVSEEFTQEVTA